MMISESYRYLIGFTPFTHLGKSHIVSLDGTLRSVVKGHKVLEHPRGFVERTISIVFRDTVLLKEVILYVRVSQFS